MNAVQRHVLFIDNLVITIWTFEALPNEIILYMYTVIIYNDNKRPSV